jgi:hypothetical protein
MKSNNSYTENLFEEARRQEPVLGKDEIHKIVAGGEPDNAPKGGATSRSNLMITGIGIFVLIISGTAYFTSSDKDAGPDPQAVTLGKINPGIISPPAIPEKIKSAETKTSVEVQSSDAGVREKDGISDIKNPEPEGQFFQPLLKMQAMQSGVNIKVSTGLTDTFLELTNSELLPLGIITKGNTLSYSNIIGRAPEIENEYLYFTLEIDRIGGWKSVQSSTDNAEKIKSSRPFWPVFIQNLTNKELVCNANLDQLYREKFFNAAKKFLVPVYVKLKPKAGPFGHETEILFWFIPTEELFKALPADMSERVRTLIPEGAVDSLENLIGEIKKQQSDDWKITHRKYTREEARARMMQRLLEDRMLRLSQRELEKLGIFASGYKLEYKNTFITNEGPAELKINVDKNNTNKVSLRTGLPEIQITKHSLPFYPVCLTDSNLMTADYFYPDTKSTTEPEKTLEQRKRFYDSVQTMVPVIVDISARENYIIHNVLWFPMTEEFLKALPEHAIRKLSYEDREFRPGPEYINLAGINVVELTEQQLLQLGVVPDAGKGIMIPLGGTRTKQYYLGFKKIGITIGETPGEFDTAAGDLETFYGESSNDSIKRIIAKPIRTAKLFPEPLLVTDNQGHNWKAFNYHDDSIPPVDFEKVIREGMSDSERKMRNERSLQLRKMAIGKINSLIPVLVRSKETYTILDRANGVYPPDLILWYEPTDAFLNALPAELGGGIKTEYDQILSPVPANFPSSCRYFEICRYSRGPMEQLKVYPNPFVSELSIEMELGEKRTINLRVTDIAGKLIRSETAGEQQAGKFMFRMNMGELKDGLYMLIIETEKGERITERIMRKQD